MKNFRAKNIIISVFMLVAVSCSCAFMYNSTAEAQTIISETPYYDAGLNCYVQVTTETYTEYSAQLGCNVVKKKTTTTYYTYKDNNYVLLNQTLKDEIVSYEPVATASPSGMPQTSPSPYPQQTPQPSATAAPTAAATETPAAIKLTAPVIEVNRKSNTKARIRWKAVENADGYIIYRSAKEYSGYTKVRKVRDGLKTGYSDSGLNSKTTYYYKVRAYQETDTDIRYTKLSEPEQLVTMNVKKIEAKFDKLKKMYPDGMYWNHVKYKVGAAQSTYGYVTRYPCKHNGRLTIGGRTLYNMSSTCNYYNYFVDGKLIRGYQCAGFAALLNDKVFGSGKFTSFRDYKKAKVGDCLRYNNEHSAIIISKHSNYIRVAECNYGNECKIKWGRKIKKKELGNVVFYRK